MKETRFSKIKLANLLLTFSLGLLVVVAISRNKWVFYLMVITVSLGAILKLLGTREKYLKIKKGLKV